MTSAAKDLLDRLHLPPCRWMFPPVDGADQNGLVVVGGDLNPETLVTAYAGGMFPMPVGLRRRTGWWSPNPRGILPSGALVVTRSLRRSLRRYEVRVDTAFTQTMSRCADPNRPHGWITREFVDGYTRLHELGIAHSIETWDGDRLVGGLYGVSLAGLFAGESMFHDRTDASKVALVALTGILGPEVLLDVQWLTPHLATLGAIAIPRSEYLARLEVALGQEPPVFTAVDGGLGEARS